MPKVSTCLRNQAFALQGPPYSPDKTNADILAFIIPISLSPDLLEHKYSYVSNFYGISPSKGNYLGWNISKFGIPESSPPANSILSFSNM
jgi:hypothetical protein